MAPHPLLSALALATIPLVFSQTNSANCTDATYNWVFNSKGQSPCFVAEVLAGPCDPAGFNIPPLPTGQVYFGPTFNQANSCECSSVFYSLLSACAACQGRNWIRWSSYSSNCSQVWLTVYANAISPSTSVPHWAYLNIASGDNFDASAAQSAGGPESTAVSATSTPTSTSASKPHSSNHAGAIAGGVVGGIVFLGLVTAAAAWFYVQKKKSSGNVWTSVQTHGQDVLPSPHIPGSSTEQPMYQLQKLYDPQDPTTFPPAAHQNMASVIDQSLTGTTYVSHPEAYKVHSGNYTGVPEV